MGNVRQFIRDGRPSNRIFRDHGGIVEHCCHASNRLVDQPWRIISIGLRTWPIGSDQWELASVLTQIGGRIDLD